MDTHGRIFGDGDGASRATSWRSASNKKTSPVNGLADNIIEVHHGRYLMTDSDGKNDLVLNQEELCFILDGTVVQDTAPEASNDTNRAPSLSSHRAASLLEPPPARRSSTSESGDSSNGRTKPAMFDADRNKGSSKEGDGRTTLPRQHLFRKKPLSPMEKLLSLHTTEVLHEPSFSSQNPPRREVSAKDSSSSAALPDCSICLTSAEEESPYKSDKDVSRDLVGCVAMKLCGHHFHTSCLLQMASHNTSCLVCPNCQAIHGVRMGTQPEGGRMHVLVSNASLPGYPGCKTIQITYSFDSGTQGPEHPNPGKPYRLVGFPRIGYLPDNNKGKQVLNLLQVAFNRRLVFTVGTSASSGSSDCVVWNGIHHKTETQNSSGHGYPDPKYLDNVMMELASLGVA